MHEDLNRAEAAKNNVGKQVIMPSEHKLLSYDD